MVLCVEKISFYTDVFWRKVYKNSTWMLEKPYVIIELCPMIVVEFFNGFTLYDDVIFA